MDTRILLCLSLGATLVGGEPPVPSWPKVLRIGVEDVKPGKEAAHQKNEFAWSKVLAQAKSPYHFLGLVPVVGANQATWVWFYDSLAGMEAQQAYMEKHPALKAQVEALAVKDAEYITTYSSAAYMLRGDLSREIGNMAPRYYWTSTIQVKPGHDAEFAAGAKKYAELCEKAGLKPRWAVYQAVAGTANPTFLWVVPLHSLADADATMADDEKMAKSAGPEELKGLSKLVADCFLREDAQLLAVDPKMSYPDAGDIAADPEFWKAWTAKPAPKAAAAK
ncbi:MAG TPA: hypothetical protein VJ528_00370 [Geothrix sp.]|uniref:hypothetical protein n=1 Tax=Geothrix mesophila TaxID=2922723 RepID=UPI001FAD55E5|nr:hypothetical protein [Geothrix sp. SG198]HJV37268.1 hypothetical protein [Geothrix sp.]